jgi:predicted DNA-binding transcriptional regulator AlpA
MVCAGEIAAEMGVDVRTLRRWPAAGRFPPPDKKIGRVMRWRPSTVIAWFADDGAPPAGES